MQLGEFTILQNLISDFTIFYKMQLVSDYDFKNSDGIRIRLQS